VRVVGPGEGIEALLKTRGTINIRASQLWSGDLAVQIANNLQHYYSADCAIINRGETASGSGNVISLHLGVTDLPDRMMNVDRVESQHPLQVSSQNITLKGTRRDHTYCVSAGVGVIYLVPLSRSRIKVVIWGFDDEGLTRAARLLPTLTGVGQPDFAVLGRECAWKGAAGVLAMGYFKRSHVPETWLVTSEAYRT